MHIEVDILRRQVTYHVYNAGCFIRLNRVSYPGYVVYIISGKTIDNIDDNMVVMVKMTVQTMCIRYYNHVHMRQTQELHDQSNQWFVCTNHPRARQTITIIMG